MTRKSHIIHKAIKGGSKLEIFIPQFVRTALDRLNECGYEGYIVGGCVRDSLLGKSLMITMSAQTASLTKCLKFSQISALLKLG